jgi:hypothetical protein
MYCSANFAASSAFCFLHLCDRLLRLNSIVARLSLLLAVFETHLPKAFLLFALVTYCLSNASTP